MRIEIGDFVHNTVVAPEQTEEIINYGKKGEYHKDFTFGPDGKHKEHDRQHDTHDVEDVVLQIDLDRTVDGKVVYIPELQKQGDNQKQASDYSAGLRRQKLDFVGPFSVTTIIISHTYNALIL